MQLKGIEKKENNQVELSISVDQETFEKALEKSYRKNVGKMSVPGFRKGKAPRKVLEKMYGEGVFFEDAVNFCYPEAYDAAVAETNIEPVDHPDVTVDEITGDGFSFKALVTVKPEVKIENYKGISAEKPKVSVTEKDVKEELGRMVDRNARLVTVERAVKDGDTVVFDFEGSVDGVPFEGGKSDNYTLGIGSGMFIPGFEEQMVGKKVEESFEVTVTFPEEYHAKELAGKPAVFKCLIHEVKETQKPELDDEFAKDVSEFDTLDELKRSYPEHTFHLIIGSDNWTLFPRWYESERILAENRILVYPRPGYPVDAASLPEGVKLVNSPVFEISSTFIRRAMEEGKDVRYFLHPAVYEALRTARF